MPRVAVHLIAFVAVAAACRNDTPRAESVAAGVIAESSDVVAGAIESYVRRPPVKRIPWTVTFEGAGPLRPGMSLARSVIVMDGDLWTRDKSISCAHFRAARAPGIEFVFLDRFLARIEVDSGKHATPEGVKIGSTEDQVHTAYPGRVSITQDKFTNARYLTVEAHSAADSAQRIVFETDGNRVIRYRTGVRFAVEWVEGCG